MSINVFAPGDPTTPADVAAPDGTPDVTDPVVAGLVVAAWPDAFVDPLVPTARLTANDALATVINAATTTIVVDRSLRIVRS
jgi:hypothetical protein